MRNSNMFTAKSTLKLRGATIALSALTLATTAALAQQRAPEQQKGASGSSASAPSGNSAKQNAVSSRNDQQLMESWAKMRGEVVEANEILSADVSNGLNPVGQVRDLVLTPDHKQVQYILYETPYPYSFYGAEDGFARYDGVEFENEATFDTTLRLDAEDSAGAPEELKLTRDQARERLVSRLIGSAMLFSDDTTREVDDILIDRDTGAVNYYVVETDEDSIFGAERRTVPAARVSIADDGQLTAALRLRELDDIQTYDPALL